MHLLQQPTQLQRRLALLLMVLAVHQLITIVHRLTPIPMTAHISLSPLLEIAFSTLWMLMFVGQSVPMLWPMKFNRWRSFATTRQVIVLLTIFGLYQILRLVAFAQADYDRQRLPFLMLIWLVWVIVWWAVELTNSARRRRLLTR